MNISEIVIAGVGSVVSILIGIVGYLLNKQLQRVDDKVSTMDNQFFEVKSKMIEISKFDKNAILDHLNKEVMPYLKSKSLDDQIAGLRSEMIILKEYQRNKISPAIDKINLFNQDLIEQKQKQKESDDILNKLFEVVKKLVEKKKD